MNQTEHALTPTNYTSLRYFLTNQSHNKTSACGAAARCLLRLKATTKEGFEKAIVEQFKNDAATMQNHLDMLADMVEIFQRKTVSFLHLDYKDWASLSRVENRGHVRRVHPNQDGGLHHG